MKLLTIFSFVLCALYACNQSPLVPEITPDIIEHRGYNLKETEKISRIAQFKDNIFFVSPQKRIVRFDPLTETTEKESDLKHQVEQSFLFQNNKLVLKKINSRKFFIFDLQQNKIQDLLFPHIDNPIGINNSSIIFQNKQKLILLDYPSMALSKKINLGNDSVLNCEFRDNKIIILTTKKLLIINRKNHSLKTHALRNHAASKCLLWDNHVYYGSNNRELIKLSIKSNRIKWKIKLAMILKERPQRMKQYLVITPEDNNIIFYKKNGTLHWWEKLNATRLLPAVIMKENVAVFLMNKKIKFFNPFKKKVHNFNLKTIIDSNPVYLKNYLYFLSHKKNKKKQAISKLGNHYFVKIKTDPEFLKPLGQSIQFNLTPINLIKPELNINIYHQSKGSIFKTKIKHDQVRSFVWIPDEPGKYKIELNINARNKKNMTIKKNIKIIDVEKIIRAFNYKIMQECQIDVWIQKKQPE